jgi:hypothetical protein
MPHMCKTAIAHIWYYASNYVLASVVSVNITMTTLSVLLLSYIRGTDLVVGE